MGCRIRHSKAQPPGSQGRRFRPPRSSARPFATVDHRSARISQREDPCIHRSGPPCPGAAPDETTARRTTAHPDHDQSLVSVAVRQRQAAKAHGEAVAFGRVHLRIFVHTMQARDCSRSCRRRRENLGAPFVPPARNRCHTPPASCGRWCPSCARSHGSAAVATGPEKSSTTAHADARRAAQRGRRRPTPATSNAPRKLVGRLSERQRHA